MRNLLRFGGPLIAAAMLAVTAWVAATLQSQIVETRRMLAIAADLRVSRETNLAPPDDGMTPATTIHLAPDPPTVGAARTWLSLAQTVDFPFPKETPLQEVLDFIRRTTAAADPKGPGLNIYIDPVALQEHERSMTSTVVCELKGLPLASGLKILLKQLDLTYSVQADGLLVIAARGCDDFPAHPEALMLDTLSSLRVEVAALRREVAALRIGTSPTAPPPRWGTLGASSGGSTGAR